MLLREMCSISSLNLSTIYQHMGNELVFFLLLLVPVMPVKEGFLTVIRSTIHPRSASIFGHECGVPTA